MWECFLPRNRLKFYKTNSMIRQVITAESNTIEVKLPLTYIGKQIEILIFSLDEIQEIPKTSNKTFTTIQIDTKDFKFDREEANER